MSNIDDTVAEVLRLDEEATPGPWDYWFEVGTRLGPDREHPIALVKQMRRASCPGGVRGAGVDADAALITYYRTAAPALAREVQRLQAEVRETQRAHDCAIVAAHESGRRAGQEAMRERAATLCEDWEEDSYCEGWREMEQGAQHCADAIRAAPIPDSREDYVDAPLIAYYRTAAPALAREVQRLQEEVRIDADAMVEMMEESRRVGQEAMRERAVEVCSDLITRARVGAGADANMRDLRCLESHMLQAIRALEVEP